MGQITKVTPDMIQVANNVTSKTVGNTNQSISLTFDSNGVITAATNAAINISGSNIFANTISNTNIATGAIENYLRANALDFGMRNRIINGAMRFSQRKVDNSITVTTDNEYTLDRWQTFSSVSSKFSVQQNAGSLTGTNLPVGFRNYLGVTSLAATSVGSGDFYILAQKIEGFNTADLMWGTANAQTVTLSFWVRSSLTGTFGGSILNSAQNRAYPFSYTISSANTWERKFLTIAGDTTGTWLTTNDIGMNLFFSLGMGSTYSGTAGAWTAGAIYSATGATSVVGTNGATWYLTGVQLEEGSVPTPFEYRQYGTELALCQRYYEKSYAQTSAVPTNNVGGAIVCPLGSTTYVGGAGGASSQGLQTVHFKVPKRGGPSITTYSYTSSTTGVASNYWSGADLAAQTAQLAGVDANGFSIYNASGSNQSVSSYAVMFHYAASAEL